MYMTYMTYMIFLYAKYPVDFIVTICPYLAGQYITYFTYVI